MELMAKRNGKYIQLTIETSAPIITDGKKDDR